jgi:hypothetical protein
LKRQYSIYYDAASAGLSYFRAFILQGFHTSGLSHFRAFMLLAPSEAEQSYCERSCQGSVFVFIRDVPPPHLPSTNHVNAELYVALRIVRKFERRTAMRYRADLGSGASAIASHHSYEASDHIFISSLNWLLLVPSNSLYSHYS